MSNDGFMDKAGEAAAKVFGGQEQRYKDGAYADTGTQRSAQPYPMGGEAAPAATGSHHGAQAGGEVRIGGAVAGDRGQYDDDPHYRETRASHLQAFDRDYDAFRREHGSGDHAQRDFGAWRTMRQAQHGQAQPSGEPESSRALGESASQGSDGPHILDRSFSGTYDKD